MALQLKATEVLLMAERIESNAAAFYRRAAECFRGQEVEGLFRKLAGIEDGHASTFRAMSDGLSAEENGIEFVEAVQFLDSLADRRGGEGVGNPVDLLKGNESVGQVLAIAAEWEKKSILFYLGLMDIVSQASAETVMNVIREEKEHLVALTALLRRATE